MTTPLSKPDVLRLQQLHDGETTRESVAELLDSNPAARVYMTALGEMKLATEAAMTEAWDRAENMPSAQTFAEIASQAASLVESPLADLAPMLERFHDGEVDSVEAAVVIALLEEREELAEYMFSLDSIGKSVRQAEQSAHSDVNFDNFFDGVANKLGLETESNQPTLENSYNNEDHRVLVYRYHDDEVSAEERMRVQAWVDAGHTEVTGTVDAMEEIQFCAITAVDFAQEDVDFSMFWGNLQEKLEEDAASQGNNVVSLSKKRNQKSVFADYRQGIVAAIAATVMVGGMLGLFGKQIFGTNERVIEKIVIIDSVEYAPGASVMINSPMQPASADSDEAIINDDESTVIWLLDSGEGSLEEEPGSVEETEENETGQPI